VKTLASDWIKIGRIPKIFKSLTNNFGPIIEEGLIIGIAILAIIIIVSIITSVLNWTQGLLGQFWQSLPGQKSISYISLIKNFSTWSRFMICVSIISGLV